jgi:selenocysteine-specific elongation factor
MPVVGTAGHVDHGKSTLIRALTGRDPDRWEEEKRRGLTIDLGFAWMDLDGVPVGFVDVPGHERFIKNMLAGIEAVQAALFVVAADEGWMPQSEEHLAVLDLLDLDTAVVALTRIDLVDGDTAALAALEIEEALAGTSLEGSQIVGVSAPTGQGIDELRAALASAVGRTAIEDVGRPRLWVDRSFVISGAGTVVTGTLTGGSLAVGDEVVLWPGRHQARVRSLQSHEAARETVGPGTRAAANRRSGSHRGGTRRHGGPRRALGANRSLARGSTDRSESGDAAQGSGCLPPPSGQRGMAGSAADHRGWRSPGSRSRHLECRRQHPHRHGRPLRAPRSRP